MSLRIYGNRSLRSLPGQETRPTLARVREAVFNIWQGKIVECRWLDLCAGSGSMGAEALCRGAEVVVGVERSRPACDVIQQNWQQLATENQTFQILHGDVLKKLPILSGQKFDLIYFDPPYASELYSSVLETIAEYDLLHFAGEMAVEHASKAAISVPDRLEVCRCKIYGNTGLTFLQVRQ
jgi:16S rRNA (guanine966-N2)-methyltransferase